MYSGDAEIRENILTEKSVEVGILLVTLLQKLARSFALRSVQSFSARHFTRQNR